MERNEYVTRKNISTEPHVIFLPAEYGELQLDFSLRWIRRKEPLALLFDKHE